MSKIRLTNQNVELVPKEASKGELSDVIHYRCAFCGKNVALRPMERKWCEKLSGNDFYCGFCLRHGLNTRSNHHVLVLSFRPLVAHFYHEKYIGASKREMWLSEIKDYLVAHERAGLLNPVFNYDPETMLWFVDFSRIGKGKKKIRLAEVLKTIVNILVCFNIPSHSYLLETHSYFAKFKEAVVKFYATRYRPEGKRFLIPTLSGCGITESKNYPFDEARNFTSKSLTHR